MNRAIGHQKMRSTDVQTPEVKSVALIFGAAGTEGVRAERAVWGKGSHIQLSNAEHHVGRAVFGLALPGVPPAQNAVCTRGTFAHTERVAGAVLDVEETDNRIEEQNAIVAELVRPFDAQIVRESDSLSVRQLLNRKCAWIGRATEKRHHYRRLAAATDTDFLEEILKLAGNTGKP